MNAAVNAAVNAQRIIKGCKTYFVIITTTE